MRGPAGGGAPLRGVFDVIPAIDLVDGRVVRLRQGDFARQRAYAVDAATVAARFAAEGARWLHVVDLDGARAGAPRQRAALASIREAVRGRAAIEIAGGLRSVGDVEGALAAGAGRVVLGTALLAEPGLARELVARVGAARLVAALDVRDGLAVGEGWRDGAPGVPLEGAIEALAAGGLATFEVTAIERDGELRGPDLRLLERAVAMVPRGVIASAGVRSVADLLAVQAIGCVGAIVGRALYEGRLDLRMALEATAVEPAG